MRLVLKTGWFWVGFVLLVLGVTPYLVRFIPDALYLAFFGLFNLLFAVLILGLIDFGGFFGKLKSMRFFYYSFILLAISSFFMFLKGLGFNVFELDDVVMLLAYFVFIFSLYFLFEDVYIKKTISKIIASVVFVLVVVFLFAGYIEQVLSSKIELIAKLFAVIPPIIDVVLLAGLIVVLILVHTRLFFKAYGFILVAVFFMFLSDFMAISVNASGVVASFSLTDALTLFAYFFAFLFVLRQEVLLDAFKPVKV